MFIDLYSSAVNSSNLKSEELTDRSDSDVLTAMGWAAQHHPLGAALQRLFVDSKPQQVIDLLATMARERSFKVRARITEVQARNIAEKTLAWYRFGTCGDCGGTGKELIAGTPHLSEHDCPTCEGTGRRPFEREFQHEVREIALWLRDEIAKHQARAGQAAMRSISLEL
jgi:hypothetical protein